MFELGDGSVGLGLNGLDVRLLGEQRGVPLGERLLQRCDADLGRLKVLLEVVDDFGAPQPLLLDKGAELGVLSGLLLKLHGELNGELFLLRQRGLELLQLHQLRRLWHRRQLLLKLGYRLGKSDVLVA